MKDKNYSLNQFINHLKSLLKVSLAHMMAFVVPINHWNIEHEILLEVYIILNLYNAPVMNVHEVHPTQRSAIEWDFVIFLGKK